MGSAKGASVNDDGDDEVGSPDGVRSTMASAQARSTVRSVNEMPHQGMPEQVALEQAVPQQSVAARSTMGSAKDARSTMGSSKGVAMDDDGADVSEDPAVARSSLASAAEATAEARSTMASAQGRSTMGSAKDARSTMGSAKGVSMGDDDADDVE